MPGKEARPAVEVESESKKQTLVRVPKLVLRALILTFFSDRGGVVINGPHQDEADSRTVPKQEG